MSWACGIICGADTMYEAEGFQEVDRPLKKLFRDETRRPAVLYYDTTCGYEEFLRKRKDRFWVGTQLVVDRFHFKTHVGLMCAKFNNPNHQDNPLLWHTGEDGSPAPSFNSSIAESNNAWLSGFQHIVMRMPRILSQLVVNTNIVIKNELLLHKKLLSKSPTFNP